MPEGAVYVGRPTRWGNPFDYEQHQQGRRWAAGEYRIWLNGHMRLNSVEPEQRRFIRENIAILRGKDLACWCPPDQPCHADVLLELANKS